METIHARIARLRRGKGLSKTALASKVGVHYQAVQQWENGKSAPKRTRLERVATALGITPQELATGAPQPRTGSPGADPRLDEIPGLFIWLTEDQRDAFLSELRATAAANRAIAKELGGKFTTVNDRRVENHYKFPGKSKKTK